MAAVIWEDTDMGVIEFLDKSGVSYVVSEHPSVFTAQQVAAVEHERGRFVAKPVIVKADGKYVMCVLSAADKVSFDKLKQHLGAGSVDLADEKELGKLFQDCDLGAEPPFGSLYGMPTLMDKALEADDHVLFQAGTHEKAIRMSMADYRKLADPKVMEISFR